jgi:hypothetical protein
MAAFEHTSSTFPATDLIAVTKHDTDDDPNGPFRGLAFGGAGIIKLETADGTERTIPDGVLAAGIIHPIAFVRVANTTTTATDIYGAK